MFSSLPSESFSMLTRVMELTCNCNSRGVPLGTKILFYYLDGFRLLPIFRINTSFPKSQAGRCALALAFCTVLSVLCIHFVCRIETLTSAGWLQTLQAAHKKAAPTVCVPLSLFCLVSHAHKYGVVLHWSQLWLCWALCGEEQRTAEARKRQWQVLFFSSSTTPLHSSCPHCSVPSLCSGQVLWLKRQKISVSDAFLAVWAEKGRVGSGQLV